jgi:Skp family chaperone for outer membrane proteins
MKTMIRRVLPGLMLLGLLALPAAAQPRISTIDLKKVFDNYYKRLQADAALKERRIDLEKEYQAYVDDYKKAQTNYSNLVAASNDQSLSTEEREKRKTAAESKLLELKSSENTMRTFQSNAQDQLETQMKRMRDTILAEIRNAINAKAKAAGYTMVIDTAAESTSLAPIVLYNNGENDITDAILNQLNAGAPPPASTDAPKDTDKKDDKKGK